MIAIIIPYYKIDFFEDTLKSLVNQSNKNFNVYVGNDASPDNPDTIIEKYRNYLNLTYKKFDNNLGKVALVKHWERCVEMSKEEEWLTILGDDDYYDSHVIKRFYDRDELENGFNVIRFATRLRFEEKKSYSKIFYHPKEELYIETLIKKMKGESRSSLSEYFFKRKIYMRYKFHHYPSAWHSDDRAILEFSQMLPIYTINDSLIFIRNSNHNISGRKDNLVNKNEASIQFYKYLLANYKKVISKNDIFLVLRHLENNLLQADKLNLDQKLKLLIRYFKNFKLYNFRLAIWRFLNN